MTDYKDCNDGKWHGWNGGECPVHPESVVQVMTYGGSSGEATARDWDWKCNLAPIIAFRVIKEYKGPREFWVFVNGHGDTRVSGTWREDAIHVREVIE